MREGNSKQGPISPISGDENQASNNKHSAHSREEIDISSSWNSPSTGPADARSRFRTSMIVPALDPTMTVVILARATYDWATNQRKNVTNDHFPSKLTGKLINKKRRWREPEPTCPGKQAHTSVAKNRKRFTEISSDNATAPCWRRSGRSITHQFTRLECQGVSSSALERRVWKACLTFRVL
jgi:hypothetical protein